MAVTQITSVEDLLYQIQEYEDESGKHYPQIANLLPSDDQIIDIDLNTRKVDAPDFLSVQFDHNAEVVYFRCDRYLDGMDLTNCICIIQYENAEHKNNAGKMVRNSGLFWVPYYDISHYAVDEETGLAVPQILIPWSIGGLATMYPGSVNYTIRFYQLAPDGKTYLYNMSTQIAKGSILHGMDWPDDLSNIEEFQIDISEVERIYAAIAQAKEDSITYWMDV